MSGPTSTGVVVSTSITGQPPATGRATSSFGHLLIVPALTSPKMHKTLI